ncbi:VWA domain-containing protein [Terriglobus saanensis]|uniref:VWFA-related domain-containing protein n=1 Tax=Terriglobus saanensis (strain ATCC BAA-1853 / DSM 23119 / SP1PR4) TaxID=401053 RepID=E8V0D1_TERSS|nr:VWA domain-containing protein [Terriglobus saanensis]ADV84414.1 VWFA-related domain-containing protein [Terriglobus saanensis SP1PR4]
MLRVLSFSLFVASVVGAQSVPTLRTGTQLVVVDVVVTDKNGAPVHGLKETDFALRDEGAEQKVLNFQEHPASASQRMPELPKMPPGTFTNYVPLRQDVPLNIVLLDLLNTPLLDQGYARQQLEKYVMTLQPGTPISIFALTSRLMMLQGFSSNPEILRGAIASRKTMSPPLLLKPQSQTDDESDSKQDVDSTHPLVQAEVRANLDEIATNQKDFQVQARTQLTLDAINQLSRYLSGFPGRKNLIWFTGSFPVNIFPQGDISTSFSNMPSMAEEYRDTVNLLATSQIAVYPIDSRGLFSNPIADATGRHFAMGPERVAEEQAFSEQTATEQTAMRVLASSTGGKAYVNKNDLTAAVTDAIQSGSSYYTLTYAPTDKKQEGRFHRIKVNVQGGGYRLAYREGYYAAAGKLHTVAIDSHAFSAEKAGNTVMQRSMLRGAPEATQIYFTTSFTVPGGKESLSPVLAKGSISTSAAKGPYRLYKAVFTADPNSITALPDGADKVNVGIEFVALVYDANGVLQSWAGKTLRGALAKAKYAEMVKAGVQYGLDVSVPAKGDFYIRTGVHDLASDRVGALEVPASLIVAKTGTAHP